MPYVIEPAAGLSRSLMTFLVDAYTEDEAPNTKGGVDKRTVLRLDPRLAPVKVAVLPLSRNADLSPKAKALAAELRRSWNVDFDDSGAIGRRYRRQDEIGTPYCVTVDFDTLEDDAVTVRERDTMKQERISLDGITPLLRRAPRRLLRRPWSHTRRHDALHRARRPVGALSRWRSPARSAAVAAAPAIRAEPSAAPAARRPAPRVRARPSPYLPVPAGVELTTPGSQLTVGEHAVVAYEPRQGAGRRPRRSRSPGWRRRSFEQSFAGWKLDAGHARRTRTSCGPRSTNVGDDRPRRPRRAALHRRRAATR